VSGTKDDSGGINVKVFEDVDHSEESRSYIDILDKFDALPGIQVLKQAAIERCRIREGMAVLDSGCGAGLETVRLARLVAPSGTVTGLDASEAFLAEARRRATGLRLPIEYRQGDSQRLPFADRSFDIARAERLFLYLQEPATALAELARVTRDRGSVYVIEPDFETVTINVGNRGSCARYSTSIATRTPGTVGSAVNCPVCSVLPAWWTSRCRLAWSSSNPWPSARTFSRSALWPTTVASLPRTNSRSGRVGSGTF
jgi:ubiquinone/menaquinone biosynthesis C-methylase UbiE